MDLSSHHTFCSFIVQLRAGLEDKFTFGCPKTMKEKGQATLQTYKADTHTTYLNR